VDFAQGIGVDEVAQATERVMARTRAAYQRLGIEREPFVFIKNNSGTYGMAIMIAHSADEVRSMNRRTRNKMSVGKNRARIASLAVQEGIPTATLVDRLAAEPVIYLLGYELIGGFLRTNLERGTEENLNAQGMVFRKLCMSDLRNSALGDTLPEDSHEAAEASGTPGDTGESDAPMLELVYGAIARISALATGLELAEAGVGARIEVRHETQHES
jgi:glutamate--cysteine ligase